MTIPWGVDDLASYIRKKWGERGYPLQQGDWVGLSIPELVEHSSQRNAGRNLPYVDLWVAVLDEFISWFISLYTIIWSDRSDDEHLTNFEKSIAMVLCKIIADTSAIRSLILSGFDNSSRTILRSTSEYLEVLVALIHDPSFADHFVTSDSPEGAQRFWETYLRGGKIRRRVAAAWQAFFRKDGSGDAAIWFANWGRSAQPMLSGFAHPSFGGGLFSAIPPKMQYTDENWLGIWGDKAEASVDTVYILLQFIFPVLLLDREFPFGQEGPHLSTRYLYDEADEMHRHVKIGREILASLILSLSAEPNSFVFPEIDMSIWPEE